MAVYNPTAAAPYVEGSPNYSLKRVSFRCQFVTDAAPDQVIPAGACTTPVRTSEGLYTLVIPNFLKNGTLVSAHLTVLGAAGVTGARVCQVVSYVASTGVLTFQTCASRRTSLPKAPPRRSRPKAFRWGQLGFGLAAPSGLERNPWHSLPTSRWSRHLS
jgi:hypothetical protein